MGIFDSEDRQRQTFSADGNRADLKIAAAYQRPLRKSPDKSSSETARKVANLTMEMPIDKVIIEPIAASRPGERWKGGQEKAAEAAPQTILQKFRSMMGKLFS